MAVFRVNVSKVSPALRAQASSLLNEMHRRDRAYLISVARFIHEHRDTYMKLADAISETATDIDQEQMREVVLAAAGAFAFEDLAEGAAKFAEVMKFESSWNEKMALLDHILREAAPPKQ